MPFLPLTTEEMAARGWQQADIVLVSGDAYVDHPSFGTAIVGRVLEHAGFKVCIVAQPKTDVDYMLFGTPRLAFFVNGGNIDPMVAHYTAAKRRRSEDAYTPGGKAGARPDRATIVYSKAIRRLFGAGMPIAIGGLEASLRRFAHYDYWDDEVKPSILLESGADILMFGMGEKQVVELATALAEGKPIAEIKDIKGTVYAVAPSNYTPGPAAECPTYEQVANPSNEGKRHYANACRIQQDEQDAVRGKRILQRHGGLLVVQNPPMPPLNTAELDEVYALPYRRTYHPSYEALGGIPGIEEVQFSIIHNRGCFGACNFCALAYHQGRAVTCRSISSVVEEAKTITAMPGFKGYIHDVGGPTADFRIPSCKKQAKAGLCKGKKCLAPTVCEALEADHSEYLKLLRTLRTLPKVKKVFVRSGIRFDYVMQDKDETFFEELVKHHVSGQLKVAPEHISAPVLKLMGKPEREAYDAFQRKFYALTQKVGKKQFLVPYLMSSHPGSTLKEAIELSLFLKKEGLHPEQVQDFYPTPGTISTAMFYTGLDPYTMQPVYVPKTKEEKAMQRALLQYYKPENKELVLKGLILAGRKDLIGNGPNCLLAAGGSFAGPAATGAGAAGQSRHAKGKPGISKGRKGPSTNTGNANAEKKKGAGGPTAKGGMARVRLKGVSSKGKK